MGNPELAKIAAMLNKARSAEDVFGNLAGTVSEMEKAGQRIFHQLAKAVHPDKHREGDKASACDAFAQLNRFWEEARKLIASGDYGKRTVSSATIIRVFGTEYRIENLLAEGDFARWFACRCCKDGIESDVIYKLARHADFNPLILTEAELLQKLNGADGGEKFSAYFPKVVETFPVEDSSGVLLWGAVQRFHEAVERPSDLYSLTRVREVKGSIDPKDMAWIWRRLLVALGFAHRNGVVHCCITPQNILIEPQEHGVILANWELGLYKPWESRKHVGYMSVGYRDFYPPEVAARATPSFATDIFMGAKGMLYLLDAARLPSPLQKHFGVCLERRVEDRPNDAWELLREFDELIEALWGPRTFREFKLA